MIILILFVIVVIGIPMIWETVKSPNDNLLVELRRETRGGWEALKSGVSLALTFTLGFAVVAFLLYVIIHVLFKNR